MLERWCVYLSMFLVLLGVLQGIYIVDQALLLPVCRSRQVQGRIMHLGFGLMSVQSLNLHSNDLLNLHAILHVLYRLVCLSNSLE